MVSTCMQGASMTCALAIHDAPCRACEGVMVMEGNDVDPPVGTVCARPPPPAASASSLFLAHFMPKARSMKPTKAQQPQAALERLHENQLAPPTMPTYSQSKMLVPTKT